MVYIALGDKELALVWLNKANKARDALLARLTVDPRFDGVQSDPRFADLVRARVYCSDLIRSEPIERLMT